MLDPKRTAILFTANTPHLAHANLMIDSLRDPQKGNFKGDLWVISTGLSNRAKNYCDSNNINFFISEMRELNHWEGREIIARSQPEYQNALKNCSDEIALKKSFESYRNKRMSKLILLNWVKRFGDKYDFIALGDNDLYFQKDVYYLFNEAYTNAPDRISYKQEENEIVVDSWIWKKDFHYSLLQTTYGLDFGRHEINIGFILGKPYALYRLFMTVYKEFLNKKNIDLFSKYNWHDQDLVRLCRAKNPDWFDHLSEDDIIHLCNGGDSVIEENEIMTFTHKRTGRKPYIIHFAGGAWKNYASVKTTFNVDPGIFFYRNESLEDFDEIRKNSAVNLFNLDNPAFFSEGNIKSRKKNRRKWMKAYNNGKKNVLLIGWLDIPTHKSFIDYLMPFIQSELFNLAIINGNIKEEYRDDVVWEDMPKCLSSLTSRIWDVNFARTFGYKDAQIPEWIVENAIKSLMDEYRCPERNARAITTILFSFYNETLDFYKPDVVLYLSVTNPLGKLMERLCRWKKIPIADLEWGVLPGTMTFEFSGHMAESWVGDNKEFFNQLPIDKNDLVLAEKYIEIACDESLNRNKITHIEYDTEFYVDLKSQKKIILYLESNNAASGNTDIDEERRKKHSPLFYDDKDAYKYIANLCEKNDDWHILYKTHPISITRGLDVEINEDNTTVIWSGSIYDYLPYADVAMTLVSQSAYLALLRGIPTVMLGVNQINGSGAVYIPESKKDIEKIVNSALENGFDSNKKSCFIAHIARLLKYYLFSYEPKIGYRNISNMADAFLSIINGCQMNYYCFERQSYELMACDKDNAKNKALPIVSVIIPVHNSELFLSEAIASIVNQSLKEIEVICVNNGSVDDSQDILEYWASKDDRIRIESCVESITAGVPRNIGLKLAKGKYVYLMDSDDILEREGLEKLLKVAEDNNSDLVYTFFKQVEAKISNDMPRPRFYNYKHYLPDAYSYKLERDHYRFFIQYPFPWGKLISRDLLNQEELFFDEGVRCFEDNPHNLKTLFRAHNPYVLNDNIYHLRMHNDSTTQHENPRIVGMIDAVMAMNRIFHNNNNYYEYQKYYVPYKAHLLTWALKNVPDSCKDDYVEGIKDCFNNSDYNYLISDESWELFNIPSELAVSFLTDMKVTNNDDLLRKYGYRPPKYETISKAHLYAIKICEKLHIINGAIKIKRLIWRKK